jgi:rRNA-processing protein FCF1
MVNKQGLGVIGEIISRNNFEVLHHSTRKLFTFKEEFGILRAIMSRLRKKRRQHQIKIKQKRKAKLSKLRRAYLKAKGEEAKEKILAKAVKISPRISEKDFSKP